VPSDTSMTAVPGLTDPALGAAEGAIAGARLRRAFAGQESDLPVMRQWLKSVLSSSAVLGDVLSIATELGANAIKHTASGYGGGFAVELFCTSSCIRVTVSDAGSLGEPRVIEDLGAEHGRGLLLVQGLAERMGVSGDERGRQVWAEIAWDNHEPIGQANKLTSGRSK
jgi:anti-sigma regulatory factor (Ser/Thr protein kinase)